MSQSRIALFAGVIALAALLAPNRAAAQDIETVAGIGTGGLSGDGGQATAASIGIPTAVLPSSDGGFYIATDLSVRKVSAAGVIGPVAGSCCRGGPGGDGGPATEADFMGITSMARDAAGNLYLSDIENQRIRRIGTDGIISTYAGDGLMGFTNETGPATLRRLKMPAAIALAADGTLYIADRSSIRKVRTDGIMETIAGTSAIGYNGDGIAATTAQLNIPEGIAVGADGSLYIADTGNGRIRRIAPDGIISTVVEGVAPAKLVRDSQGNLYFTKQYGHQVYRLDPQGQVTLVAGTGTAGFSGDGGAAVSAQLSSPAGLGVDAQGRLYVADYGNRRIRRITNAAGGTPGLLFADASVTEGNSGTVAAVFQVTLPAPAATAVVYDVATGDGTALAGSDYQALSTRRTIPAGQSQDSFSVLVNGDTAHEATESFVVDVTIVSGAVLQGGGNQTRVTGTIGNDDAAAPVSALLLRDDRQVLAENTPADAIPALANDEFIAADLAGGSLTIVSAPAHGTATVAPAGQAGTVADDRLAYTPSANWTGEDRFTYRVCDKNANCAQAVVVAVVRPLADRDIHVAGHTGNDLIVADNIRALPGARFAATPLVKPVRVELEPQVDATPVQPLDGGAGLDWQLRNFPVPADGQPRQWRVLVRDVTGHSPTATVMLGLDLDGNGAPSANELRCTADDTSRRCDIAVSQTGTQGVAYWVAVQNREQVATPVDLDVFEVPMIAGNGSLTMTGPGRLAQREEFTATLSWDDASLVYGQSRAGFVQVKSDATTTTGEFLVFLQGGGYSDLPVVLSSGVPKTLSFNVGARYEHMYIDVPAGATKLTVTSASTGNANFYLARQPLGETPELTYIEDAPPEDAAVAVANGPGGNESVVVQGAALQPGRWYVVPTVIHADPLDVTLTATVTGTAPVVRSGSYFNDARAGHGLFLYPAGGSLVGIWYNYRAHNGAPTWYYLQAPAPGANGLWNAKLYRGAWHGTASTLTEIGKAVVTPTGPDAFVFSYTIDGETGSEPMAKLGRGCPTRAGVPFDASSHWFDPDHAGTGYSVQMFPNYEFITAFVYDGRGEPTFLLAERNGFGDDDEVLNLTQLSGFCWSCMEGAPTRTTVGTLRRRLSANGLVDIELDAIYAPAQGGSVPGSWSSTDVLQPLGGQDTTQECDL